MTTTTAKSPAAAPRIIASLAEEERELNPNAGFGALETPRGRLPLTALDVSTHITGLTAEVLVRQTFVNQFSEHLEATYIFPLPDRAAVTSFRLTVAGRTVIGDLKERGQARADYQQAIRDGHRAAIAEEDRSGTFNLRVGNLPPLEQATVELVLVGPLVYVDGEATFRFPLVVAPRYVPGNYLDVPPVGAGTSYDTDLVPDASRITPPVLLSGFPNPVRLGLSVSFDPAGLAAPEGGWAGALKSSLHSVVEDSQGSTIRLRVQPGERLNRDFILRFPAAQRSVQTALVASPARSDRPGTFALTLVPPVDPNAPPRPRDVVFVLDRSGSMQGWKMVAARRALGRMIDTLTDRDRFSVMAFDDKLEFPSNAHNRLVTATNRQRWHTLEWLGKVDTAGGTEMGPALEMAVNLLAGGKHTAASGTDSIMVLVTDGQVAGEDMLLKTLKRAAGKSMPRIFALGIDQSVNAGFLKRLADLGGGGHDLVESESRLDEVMDRIHRAIATPALVDVRLEPLGCEWIGDSLTPSRLPDLFAGAPLTIHGRFLGDARGIKLRIHALDASGKVWQQDVQAGALAVRETARDAAHQPDVLLNLWGRAKVRELEDRYAAGTEGNLQQLAARIVKVSIESHVLSRFTAYVAVDKVEVVNQGGKQHEVVQPVEQPAGWEKAACAPQMRACAAPAPAAKFAGGLNKRADILFGAMPPAPPSPAKPAAQGGTLREADEDLGSFFGSRCEQERGISVPDSTGGVLEAHDSEFILSSSGSDTTRGGVGIGCGSGESGIALSNPDDSGISLETPVDLGGGGGDDRSLGGVDENADKSQVAALDSDAGEYESSPVPLASPRRNRAQTGDADRKKRSLHKDLSNLAKEEESRGIGGIAKAAMEALGNLAGAAMNALRQAADGKHDAKPSETPVAPASVIELAALLRQLLDESSPKPRRDLFEKFLTALRGFAKSLPSAQESDPVVALCNEGDDLLRRWDAGQADGPDALFGEPFRLWTERAITQLTAHGPMQAVPVPDGEPRQFWV